MISEAVKIAEEGSQLAESDGGTRFDYENEFELPAGKAGKLAARAFNAVTGDREARRTLARLKALLENGRR